MWIEPVTDRTLADVLARARKAYYNIEDWLRLRSNTAIVRAVVNVLLDRDEIGADLGVPVITDFPDAATINEAVAEIDALRVLASLPTATGIVALKHDYVAGSGAVAPDYQAVNAWERDLLLIRDLLVACAERVLYCGSFRCGQDAQDANRFRPWRGFVPDALDLRRVPRSGLSRAGQGRTRSNRWRSPVNGRKRAPRCGMAISGTGFYRQTGYRRYA